MFYLPCLPKLFVNYYFLMKCLVSFSEFIHYKFVSFLEVIEEVDSIIPVDNVEGKYLATIINYLELHQDDPPYFPPENYNCEISTVDKEFFEKIRHADIIPL